MMAYVKLIGCGCIALFALGCGSKGTDNDDGDDGTGGTSGSATGGTSGSSTGGSSTGGTGGSGGPLPPMTTHDFSDPTDVCPNPPAMNMEGCWKLVDSSADTAAGSTPIPPAEIMYQHTADEGEPDPGALEATIPYAEASQWVSFGINFQSQDLTNRIISARVRIVSGLGDPTELMTAPGGTKVYAKSGMNYCYANGDYFNQGDMPHPIGEWNTIQFNLTRRPLYVDPACEMRGEPFDPSDIREIGVQFDSNMASTTAETAVVQIDTVEY